MVATCAARATRSAPEQWTSARRSSGRAVGGSSGVLSPQATGETGRPQAGLVFAADPFTEGAELAGPIVPTLYVSSDAKDTDFSVKILDVYPDGRAYNLDESIQRMRYRDGHDKPLVWMGKGEG